VYYLVTITYIRKLHSPIPTFNQHLPTQTTMPRLGSTRARATTHHNPFARPIPAPNLLSTVSRFSGFYPLLGPLTPPPVIRPSLAVEQAALATLRAWIAQWHYKDEKISQINAFCTRRMLIMAPDEPSSAQLPPPCGFPRHVFAFYKFLNGRSRNAISDTGYYARIVSISTHP
jgi:hypothetical protein